MKKMIYLICISILLAGCAEIQKVSVSSTVEENTKTEETVVSIQTVSAEGDTGRITISLPEGWNGEPYEGDSEGEYGVCFAPEGSSCSIKVTYSEFAGVCGTGLEEEETVLAGDQAWIGTYDDKDYWDFVLYAGKNENISAWVIGEPEDWLSERQDEILQILDSMVYEPADAGCSEIDPQITGYIRLENKGEYYHVITEVHSVKASQVSVSNDSLSSFLNALYDAGAEPAESEKVQEDDYYEETAGASALTVNAAIIDAQYMDAVCEAAKNYEFEIDYHIADVYSYTAHMKLEVISE